MKATISKTSTMPSPREKLPVASSKGGRSTGSWSFLHAS